MGTCRGDSLPHQEEHDDERSYACRVLHLPQRNSSKTSNNVRQKSDGDRIGASGWYRPLLSLGIRDEDISKPPYRLNVAGLGGVRLDEFPQA